MKRDVQSDRTQYRKGLMRAVLDTRVLFRGWMLGNRGIADSHVAFNYVQTVPSQENRLVHWPVSSRVQNGFTTSPTPFLGTGVVRRQMRHVPDACEKFSIGDETRQEFYSPNYPDNYPNLTECIRVLEGERTLSLYTGTFTDVGRGNF